MPRLATAGREHREPVLDAAPALALGTGLACAVAALACTVLLGWVLHVEPLVRVLPGAVSMKVNTALSLLALSVTVLRPRAGTVLVPLVLLLTSTALAEHASGRSWGLGELLVEDFTWAPGGNGPGQMAIPTAFALLLLAVALGSQHRGGSTLPQVLAALAFTDGFVSTLGYAYGVSALYSPIAASSVALPTAICLMLLAAAVLVRQPTAGVVPWLLAAADAGSVAARSLTALAFAGIPALGGLRLAGELAGWYDGRFGLALMVLLDTAVLVGVAVLLGARLSVSDRARRRALLELEDLVHSLEEGRDEAWTEAARTAALLADERERFLRSLSLSDDQFATLRVAPDGTTTTHFASPDPQGLLAPLLEAWCRTGAGLVDVPGAAEAAERLRSGEGYVGELPVPGSDGTVHWVWVRARPRREGADLFVDVVATNIDERRELTDRLATALESEREQGRQLALASRSKDELITMAGHELRTPLAVIRGNLDLMDLLDPGSPLEGPVRTMRRRVAGMQVLVDDLFDLARLRTGSIAVNPTDVDVLAALHETVRELQDTATTAGVRLGAGGVAATACCDPDRLHQMLLHLVGNALAYTPAGGDVRLSVCLVPGTAGDREDLVGDVVRIEVADTGIGVDTEELPHLFDHFFRASGARDSHVGGAGLGLTLTHALAQAQHGTVSAHLREEGGMVFTLDLPAASPAPTHAAVRQATDSGLTTA